MASVFLLLCPVVSGAVGRGSTPPAPAQARAITARVEAAALAQEEDGDGAAAAAAARGSDAGRGAVDAEGQDPHNKPEGKSDEL